MGNPSEINGEENRTSREVVGPLSLPLLQWGGVSGSLQECAAWLDFVAAGVLRGPGGSMAGRATDGQTWVLYRLLCTGQ